MAPRGGINLASQNFRHVPASTPLPHDRDSIKGTECLTNPDVGSRTLDSLANKILWTDLGSGDYARHPGRILASVGVAK
jgi:hypothetical protein